MSTDRILNLESLVQRTRSGFSKKFQDEISIDEVRRVLQNIHLADPPGRPTCHLVLHRLEIRGSKNLADAGEPIPINYAQDFAPGVNVLLIEDNDVGKSSILKTIKFALTGDDSDYDADVKTWITWICLRFSLNDETFSMTVDCAPNSEADLGILSAHSKGGSLKADSAEAREVFRASDRSELKESLRQFFFEKIGLSRLTWAIPPAKGEDAPGEAGTTWLTYFQALHIPDGGDTYLLCDDLHSIGNQDGLILSSFLGLHLVEQLNWLGVEYSKQQKLEKGTQSERESLEKRITSLEAEEARVNGSLDKLKRDLRIRREQFMATSAQRRITENQDAIRGLLKQASGLQREIEEISELLTFTRSRETQLRELVDLNLHLTGLDVKLCPNCDADVAAERIEVERNTHRCRLCDEPAHGASPEEIAARRAEADELAWQIAQEASRRKNLKRKAKEQAEEIDRLRKETETLEAGSRLGLEVFLPTQDEEDQRDELLRKAGRIQAQLSVAQDRLEELRGSGASDSARKRILKKAREILQEEATQRNKPLLTRLSELTQKVSQQIGAESITDVECSSLGSVKLTKHGQTVRFKGINNQGERMRVKVAFFLAMMQLGSEVGLGRHPGFLLVDQPGSAEMVPEDFRALAKVLHSLDESLEEQIQVLCFTARPEFEAATRPERVYRSQSGKYAF